MALYANDIFPPKAGDASKASGIFLGLCLCLSVLVHAGAYAFMPYLKLEARVPEIQNLQINLVSLAAPRIEPQKIEPAAGDIKAPKLDIRPQEKPKQVFAQPQPPKEIERKAPPQKVVKKETPKQLQTQAPRLTSHDQGHDQTSVIPVIKNVNILKQTPPVYPSKARRMGQEGTVLLHALVSQNGHPQDLKIVSSSGYHSLDRSAMKAVKNWTFASATKDGRAMKAWVEVPVRFVLR